MSAAPDDLAVRKQLLIARSQLQRTNLRTEAMALRTTVTASPVFSLLAGTSRAAGWAARMAGVLAVARTVISVVRLVRR